MSASLSSRASSGTLFPYQLANALIHLSGFMKLPPRFLMMNQMLASAISEKRPSFLIAKQRVVVFVSELVSVLLTTETVLSELSFALEFR